MQRLLFTFLGATLAVFGSSVWAQDSNVDRPQRRGPEFRQRMIEEFDADGDGALSEEERQTAREAMRERRTGRAPRPERAADAPDAAGRGPGRGPANRPDPNEVFDRFDENGDGMLSREEFRKFTEEQRNRRGARGIGGPPRDSAENPGDSDRPRPPRQARNNPPGEPLLNPADRAEASPPVDRQPPRGRGLGPGPRRPGDGAVGLGSGPGGGLGFMARDPNQIFDRFDENGDGQLSREEFMQLTDSIRERAAQRFGPPEGVGRGRGGGPRDGADRPGRRQRPPLEDELGDPPAESGIL